MTERHPATRKRVVYDVPGTAQVEVRRGCPYSPDGATLDFYAPLGSNGENPLPAVVFVSGLPDAGALKMLGCRINEMESFVSWGRLVAAHGLMGITYTTSDDPAADVTRVLDFLKAGGSRHGVDASRLGLWACSSHVPTALSALMCGRASIRCAVLCYGLMLDLNGATGVADAARTWRFANPTSGRTVADLQPETPLFIVRAGQDAIAGVNESIDRFVPAALAANLALTVVNLPAAPHAFDLDDDGVAARDAVEQILNFLRVHLDGVVPLACDARPAGP